MTRARALQDFAALLALIGCGWVFLHAVGAF